jgi:ankyrin repeat protein
MTDAVKLLPDHPDIDPNFVATRLDGRSALMRAAIPEVAKLLLDRDDIDVNLQDEYGYTALSLVCLLNRISILVSLLLEREDIDPNVRDSEGRTALTISCLHSASVDVAIVRSLLSHPDTDPDPVDNSAVSAFLPGLSRIAVVGKSSLSCALH